MIVYVLFVCSFAVATAEFVLVGLLPQVATDLDVSVAAAGQLVTAYMIVVTVGGPVATVLTRRLPRRELLAGTMALATVSAVASAMATSYPMLLSARLGSALAQALFMAVASQVAMASVPPERQTVAVARLFGGFALATVLGLPLGSLIGEAYGWPVTFVAVAGMAALGLLGVLVFCPRIPTPPPAGVRDSVGALLRPGIYAGLGVTLLALTGFVAAFTYVAPMLRTVTGLSPGWVSVGLVLYGLGTIAGNLLAGRVRPEAITRRLPLAVGALTAILLVQPLLLPVAPLALTGLALLGAAAHGAHGRPQPGLDRPGRRRLRPGRHHRRHPPHPGHVVAQALVRRAAGAVTREPAPSGAMPGAGPVELRARTNRDDGLGHLRGACAGGDTLDLWRSR
ncbi:MFS transporter [Verrucosispora sioxanthis]|uniref:MFS transporter n=1 Tax=Verrucosispora sioxanthis TaxID=2499994 RepID=UPI001C108340|nr:MFS transporter [Verrucosispora sioxanthis]